MAIGSPQWMYKSGEAYTIDQSLKYNDDDSASLTRTPSSTSNRKTWTWSAWVKRGAGGFEDVFKAFVSTSNYDSIQFDSDGALRLFGHPDTTNYVATTSAVFRDSSAWYHFVVVLDTTQSTSSNRIKIYANGTLQTLSGTYPGLDGSLNFNKNTAEHSIAPSNFDGYLAEVNFIDGQALTPSSFGETGDYGEWKPKEYSGTYGTNGFYLPFKNDYTVEGFSTVTYKGNGTTQYIGGVGFKPDLTWIKSRSSADSHTLQNSVTGVAQNMSSNGTQGEGANARLSSFDTDGFTLTNNTGANGSGKSFVAWNWDMGDGNSGTPYAIVNSGDVDHSTDQKKFGASSIHFDTSTNAGLLSITDSESNSVFDFGSSDWTVECWLYPSFSNNRTCGIFAKRTDGGYGGYSAFLQESDGKIGIVIDSNNTGGWEVGITSTSAISENTWSHVAWQKSGTEYSLWINGVKDATTATSSSNPYANSQDFRIGCGFDGTSQRYNGYMDDFKVFNEARWTSNFDPETSSERNREISNALLRIQSDTTNGSTTFVDSSGAAKNTDGSITSYVAANPTYGQSIVSWTGSGATGSVGHGLNSAPELVIIKNREDSGFKWPVHLHNVIGGTGNHRGALNETSAFGSVSYDHTSSIVNLPGHTDTNKSSTAMIMYCFHSVTGYSKIGSYTGNGSSTGPSVTTGFKPAFIMIKCSSSAGPDSSYQWVIADSTRSPTNTRGNVLKPNVADAESDDFYIVDFNNTGFQIKETNGRVNANGETYIYMVFADKREYAYWLDQSGNNNDWTSNNLQESDISVDSPTNNFATLNPNCCHQDMPITEGNTRISGDPSGGSFGVAGTIPIPSSGKWYWEVFVDTLDSNRPNHYYGVDETKALDHRGTSQLGSGQISTSYVYQSNGNGTVNNGSESSYGAAWSDNDIIGVALDMDNGTLKYYRNNTAESSGANAFTGLGSKNLVPTFSLYKDGANAGSNVCVVNFGQDSSFAGNKTAQGNQDSNDIGDFYYTPPTGFLALCTSNLPDVAVTPSEHFNTVLYTGDGGSSNAVTGVGFQPDLLWIKNRTNANSHSLVDSVRGESAGALISHSTNAEDSTDRLNLDSDGFTLTGNYGFVNTNTDNYVSWNWKANGSGSSNSNGSITSTVSANADAGFSIVSYSGNSTDGASIGHGLSKAPQIIIAKARTADTSWYVYCDTIGTSKTLYLQNTNAATTSGPPWTSVSSTTFAVNQNNDYDPAWINKSGNTYIAYCFHSVDGYSKVGQFSGNSNADGTFVYTGFRPAFIMVKRTDSTGHWEIHDTKRDAINQSQMARLFPNYNSAESNDDGWDILSNGFKLRTTHSSTNAGTIIYLAFAETPFKYSNAR